MSAITLASEVEVLREIELQLDTERMRVRRERKRKIAELEVSEVPVEIIQLREQVESLHRRLEEERNARKMWKRIADTYAQRLYESLNK